MATAALTIEGPSAHGIPMPVEEYLRTMFHPDRDYVNGVAEHRPVGEWDHGTLQFRLAALLMTKQVEWQIRVVGEVRLQVNAVDFRVPDVMVLRAGEKVHRFQKVAPILCVEVLSPEDRFSRLQLVVNDYCTMGVASVWALDPETRTAYYCDKSGFRRTEELAVSGTDIHLTAAEIFALLDDE